MNRDEYVFAGALAVPRSERPSFLDRQCDGDAVLRARVEALLEVHEQAPHFLEVPLSSRHAVGVAEKAGDVIGRYYLIEKIGEGGCGVVWLADQGEPVRRRVALKIIKLGMDTTAVVARFEVERQALALMDHPNIAKVHDAGATATGRPFFVMELVRGVPITTYCDDNHLTSAARLKLFIKVCHAVNHAHQKGIIHRDLKPSNLLVAVHDGVPTPKVIDFGIASATQGRLTDATVVTAVEQLIGTPAAGYMEWLRAQVSRPLVAADEITTDADWERVGQRVFDELDQPRFRTDHPRALAAVRDRTLLDASPLTVAPDGQIPVYRWVVEAGGRVRLSVAVCTACHTRLQPDDTLLRGPPRNMAVDRVAFPLMAAQAFKADDTGQLLSRAERAYIEYGVPWLPDDIHARLREMKEDELAQVTRIQILGTANRFNGSPFYVTKIPDLIGIKHRRYLDATATHRNRGPEDIARYAALVTGTDDGSIAGHRVLTDQQRRLEYHYSDAALYALGRYIYSLEPPPNPNPFDERARRGEELFHAEGCAKCHTPPTYTNNQLTRVDGFVVPDDHPDRKQIMLRSVHTDPSLALRTRKGTGLYKVPSLRGVWYRGVFEHSGSVLSLEDWFDPRRLNPDYVPTGWKGPPGTTHRAVMGHEFGLDLTPDERSDLIAFLRTL